MTTIKSELVHTKENKVLTTSRKIAQKFNKRHADVIRAINKLDCSSNFNQRNFAPVEYIDNKGELRPEYLITKDGFVFLVMGFTGKLAAQFKEEYIEAFNEAERAMKNKDQDMGNIMYKHLSILNNIFLQVNDAHSSLDTHSRQIDDLYKMINKMNISAPLEPYLSVTEYLALKRLPLSIFDQKQIANMAEKFCLKKGKEVKNKNNIQSFPVNILEQII